MKLHIILISLLLGLSVTAGPGGPGHSHATPSIAAESTTAIGRYHIERLVKKKKLDSSWVKAKFEKVVKKKFGSRKEWVLTFLNPNGKKGKKLFIFLSLSGEFIAANFSGK